MVATKFHRITICRFTTWITKNDNLQEFKELQHVDYNMRKVVIYFLKHLYKF